MNCDLFYDDDDPTVCLPKMYGKVPTGGERVCALPPEMEGINSLECNIAWRQKSPNT